MVIRFTHSSFPGPATAPRRRRRRREHTTGPGCPQGEGRGGCAARDETAEFLYHGRPMSRKPAADTTGARPLSPPCAATSTSPQRSRARR